MIPIPLFGPVSNLTHWTTGSVILRDHLVWDSCKCINQRLLQILELHCREHTHGESLLLCKASGSHVLPEKGFMCSPCLSANLLMNSFVQVRLVWFHHSATLKTALGCTFLMF